MQKDKYIPLHEALDVIDNWLSRKHNYFWDKPVEYLIEELINKSIDGKIKYHDAVKIVQDCKTSKMPGHANRGLEYFKQIWKKMYVTTSEDNIQN